jgi:hypothetical protein
MRKKMNVTDKLQIVLTNPDSELEQVIRQSLSVMNGARLWYFGNHSDLYFTFDVTVLQTRAHLRDD